MAIRIGHNDEGQEVRVAVAENDNGGATIGFIRDGQIEILALTGSENETARALAGVTFDEDEN